MIMVLSSSPVSRSAWIMAAIASSTDCSVSNCQLRDGMMVPTRGQAAWVRPEGRRPYFVGDLTSLAYEFAP